jgi:hypothetical protein
MLIAWLDPISCEISSYIALEIVDLNLEKISIRIQRFQAVVGFGRDRFRSYDQTSYIADGRV